MLAMLILVRLTLLPSTGVMAAKNQTGFFSVIVLPMLEAFVDGFSGAAPLLEQAKANIEWWKTRTAANYTIQDIGTYSSAMIKSLETQKGSLRDWPTDLDRETGLKIPETDSKTTPETVEVVTDL